MSRNRAKGRAPSRKPTPPRLSRPLARAGPAARRYTEQEYMEDMMALRREFESRLEELEGQREEGLNQIPAAAEALARLHRKIQEAVATRDRVLQDADRTLREALNNAETERSLNFTRADEAFRDHKTELDRKLEDESRKARERLEEALREIEARFPSLSDQIRHKERAHEEYRRELKAAQDTHNREWDRQREDYQTARHDALTRERLAGEAASSRADFARSEADRAHEQSVLAAKAIFRMEVATVAPDVQAEFDDRRQQLLKDWEARKDALSERYRRERQR
jgi:hypothetical protein